MSDMPLTDNPFIIGLLVLIAVAIVYPITRALGRNSMTARKREDIERKRAALEAKRKVAAQTRQNSETSD